MINSLTTTITFFKTSEEETIQKAFQIAEENSFLKPMYGWKGYKEELSKGSAVILGKKKNEPDDAINAIMNIVSYLAMQSSS